MKFIKDASPAEAANYLADAINTNLSSGLKVLWLVSGGSAASVAVETLKLIDKNYLQNLSVGQVDERFGPPGHKDSNWQQLLNAGFQAAGLRCLPILAGKDFDQTAKDAEILIEKELVAAEYRVGLFGIGPDGHTAGILPLSAAVDSQLLLSAYIAPDFERLTLTARAIAALDLAVAYATGEPKREALLKLQRDLSVREQPAQALKLAKQTVIFNDQIGDQL
jgi:6-phosphogluconolactonase/glucosamine-6-phosphate isomerase/deaminase